jgi:hypothetical protein
MVQENNNMHHSPSESLRVGGEPVAKDCADGSTTLERKSTSSSDNDVTTTMSTASSSQGSFQVLAEPEAQEQDGPSHSPSRSPRRKSSLNKTESMLRGSIKAQDFFGTDRVFQEFDPKDNELSAPNQGQEKNLEIEVKEAVSTENLVVNTDQVESERGAVRVFQEFDPNDNKLSASNQGQEKNLEMEVKEAVSTEKPAASSAQPLETDGLVGSKCQCIIL